MDNKIACTANDRMLRIVTLVNFIPAICLAVPWSVHTYRPLLGLGLIPMAASAAVAMHILVVKRRPSLLYPAIVDFLIAAFLLGILLPFWLEHSTYWGGSIVMLGAYATVPMMMNLAIHTIFAIRGCYLSNVLSRLFSSPECPHCRHQLRASDFAMPGSSGRSSSSTGKVREIYSAVPGNDADEGDDAVAERSAGPSMSETPRASFADEKTSLV